MAIVKRRKIKYLYLAGVLAAFFLVLPAALWADDTPAVSEAEAPAAPKSELDNLKAEWEAVREQQIQMIREKEDQLEKLKEEIFAKMKTTNAPVASQSGASQAAVAGVAGPVPPAGSGGTAAPGSSAEFEAQKAAFQAERQKFFQEMSRQKESLRKLQTTLDEKAKQLEADRVRFEQEKKTAAHQAA
jgi:flagellar motility protein MotE (MotC chaperone)